MQPDFEEVVRSTDPNRRQLERRSAARRRKVLRNNPETGPFLLAMSDEPTAETAFDDGAPWQRWVAELVRREFPDGIFLFHRRRGAGHPGDIDIVGVLPSGVWVIDIQRFDGAKAEVRHRQGTTGRRDYLYVDETDQSAVLDDLELQGRSVSEALERAGYPLIITRTVLCLVDIEAAWRGHATVGDNVVAKARQTVKLLGIGPRILDDTSIASLGMSLDKQLARQHRLV